MRRGVGRRRRGVRRRCRGVSDEAAAACAVQLHAGNFDRTCAHLSLQPLPCAPDSAAT